MGFSHNTTWDYFEEILNLKLPMEESWQKMINHLQSIVPKVYWEEIKAINVNKEQGEIKDWLEQLVKNNPLPDDTIALWIGITKLWDSEANIGEYAIYLTGSNSYEEEGIEWAHDANYDPENKYIIIEDMTAVDQIINKDENDYGFLDWILPLAYCAFSLDEIFRAQLNSDLFLHNQTFLYTCTGHDSGDYINLSYIAK